MPRDIHPRHDTPVDTFTLELLRSGLALSDLAAEMIEAIPPDTLDGRDPGVAVMEMISESVRGSLAEVDPAEVRRATALMHGALDRVSEDMHLALALAERMRGEGRHGRLLDEPELDPEDAAAGFAANVRMGFASDDLDGTSAEGAGERAADDPVPQMAEDLLDLGGALSQIVAGIVAGPDAAEVNGYVATPAGAARLLCVVLDEVTAGRDVSELTALGDLVADLTHALLHDVVFVNPELN